jgi:MFS family permease
MSDSSQQAYARPAWLITVLAIAPAIGLGICRFAFALVLPDMRESLGWSWFMAGLMNTVNSAGYLVGAFAASTVIRRFGMLATVKYCTVICIMTLALSAITDNAVVFGLSRLISGIAGAFAMISGGALASHVAQAQPTRQSYYLSLYYIGPAVGILIPGFVAPFLLEWCGAGSWWIVWTLLAAISAAMSLALPAVRLSERSPAAGTAKAAIRTGPIIFYLIGYTFFGAGYIAYMTYMIAYVRNPGAGAAAQSAFWTCIGVGVIVQPWVWGSAMAKAASGRLTALLLAITAVGALIPALGDAPLVLAISAAVFGNAFFAVVSSATALARLNYPPSAWPSSIAMVTLAFGIGQTLGPIATGAITDAFGSLSYALNVSDAMLVTGVVACMIHTITTRDGTPRTEPLRHGRSLMLIMLAWLAPRAIRLVRPRYSCSDPHLVTARMGRRKLRDIGLTCANAQSRHLHFANAEVQLGMIR